MILKNTHRHAGRVLLIARATCAAFVAGLLANAAVAQQSAEELAMQLANPIATLISVPFQLNHDSNIGRNDQGDRLTMNFQPVIPIELNDDWNLISRTIMPFVSQDDVVPGSSQSGVGDIIQSLFFSPAAPTQGGWIWGAGPVIMAPTGSDDLLTTDQWSAGPTGVVLRQQGQWTYGALANHLWSLSSRDGSRPSVNATFLQPFLSYTTRNAVSFTVQTEASYDWTGKEWTVPLGFFGAKVTRIGSQLVSIGGGLRYYASSPNSGPEDWAVRFNFVLMYPK